MSAARLNGRCLCGSCQFSLEGPPNWVAHCHCASCRKATASPFTTWIGQENGRWATTGLPPAVYHSSPGNQRGFCPRCGTPLFYQSARFPHERHFYAALLDDPDQVSPQMHVHRDEQVSWLHLADGLPNE